MALCLAAVTQRHATFAFPDSAPHMPGSPPGRSSSLMTLRVRMPDGAVKRVTAASSDTVEGVMGQLGVGGAGEVLGPVGGEPVVDSTTSLASMGLRNGDFLYVKVWEYVLSQAFVFACYAVCVFSLGIRFLLC